MKALRKVFQLSTPGVLGLAFCVWVIGFFVISPIFQNAGYLMFLWWEMVGPISITVFLYARAIHITQSKQIKIRLHVAWLTTSTVISWLGIETWISYMAMDEAPRGLIWDVYQFSALVVGVAVFWIFYGIAYPFTKAPPCAERVPRERND